MKKSSYSFLKGRNIKLVILCRVFWGLTQFLFLPYFSLFVLAQKGVTLELLGLIISMRGVGLFIVIPLAGHLADSLGRRRIIFVGTFLHAVSYLFYFFGTDFNVFFIGSLIEGLSSVHLPAIQALLQDSLAQNNRGLGLSVTLGLQALPTLVSPFVGGILAEQLGLDLGMRIGFALAFSVGVGIAFVRLKFLKETLERNKDKIEFKRLITIMKKSYLGMFNILKEYKILKGLLFLTLINTFFTAIALPFWIVYARNVVGISPGGWGLIESILAVVNVLFLLFSGNFIDRFGKKKVMVITLLFAPITNLLFVYCQNLLQVLLVRMVLTIQNAFLMPAVIALMADIVPRKNRGRAIAAFGLHPVVMKIETSTSGFFRFFPYFAGSLISGYVFRFDPRYPWFLVTIGYSVGLILCYFLIKEPEKPAE